MSESVPAIQEATEADPIREEQVFALVQREAKAMAASSLVPKDYQDSIPNCLIALNLARRIGADPLMVVQNLDVIHGRPSFRAAFLIACVNRSGRFSPLRYRVEGEGLARTCVAYARDLESGDEIEGPPVSMQMAKDEGWSTRSGSKWKTMPDLMLRYRAAAFFARTTAPELTMGLSTAEEMEDVAATSRRGQAEESRQSAADALAAAKDVTPQTDPEPAAEDEVPPEVDPETGEVIPPADDFEFE